MSFVAAVAVAAPQTAADKLRQIPVEFWWKMAVGIVALVIAVILLRKLAKVNKVVLAVGVLVFTSMVGFNWVYERNEPTWASPAVQWLSGFFPSKGKVEKIRS